jgi:hypothetical protein
VQGLPGSPCHRKHVHGVSKLMYHLAESSGFNTWYHRLLGHSGPSCPLTSAPSPLALLWTLSPHPRPAPAHSLELTPAAHLPEPWDPLPCQSPPLHPVRTCVSQDPPRATGHQEVAPHTCTTFVHPNSLLSENLGLLPSSYLVLQPWP